MKCLVDKLSMLGMHQFPWRRFHVLTTLFRSRLCDVWLTGVAVCLLSSAQFSRAGGDILASDNVAAIKQKADAGDVKAQLALADCLANNMRPADALAWYKKAISKGSSDAKARAAELLLYGSRECPADQKVAPNPIQGVRWTYELATNRYPPAYRNMAYALQRGVGVQTNIVEAYAWLLYYTNTNAVQERIELNRMALGLDLKQIKRAEELAWEFKRGDWPPLKLKRTTSGNLPLELSGIMFGKRPLATINRRTLSEGESTSLSLKTGPVTITCVKIEPESVIIEVSGESEPRYLSLR